MATAIASAAFAQPKSPPAQQAAAASGTEAQQAPAAPPDPDLLRAIPDDHGVKRMAILRGLNKVTGRAIDIKAPAGLSVPFGHLSITLRFCYTVPPEEPPETAAFLQIDDLGLNNKPQRVFSGWMFASTPALNGLEHPVYDVWVITCKTEAPEAPPADAAAPADGVAPPGLPADIPPPQR